MLIYVPPESPSNQNFIINHYFHQRDSGDSSASSDTRCEFFSVPPVFHSFVPTSQADPTGKGQRAVSATDHAKNDVSYTYCQVCPDHIDIKNNFLGWIRQFTQLSFVSLLSG